jgi:hypothetical protein
MIVIVAHWTVSLPLR